MTRNWYIWFVFFIGLVLFVQDGEAFFLNSADITRLEAKTKLLIKDLPHPARNVTMYGLLGINPTFLRPDDHKAIQRLFNATAAEKSLFNVFTIGDMITALNISWADALNKSTLQLFSQFWSQIEPGTTKGKYPIIYAAHLKGITVAQLAGFPIVNLAVAITGLSEQMIQKIYQIPLMDFYRAKNMSFGQLPAYMNHFFYNGTSNKTELKMYYTMSFHSIAKAILIHKNATEATEDFLNDFKYIVNNIKISDLLNIFSFVFPSGYMTLDTFSIETLAGNLSGLDRQQTRIVFNTTSDYYLKQLTIDYLRLMNVWGSWSGRGDITLGRFFNGSVVLIEQFFINFDMPVLYLEHMKGVLITRRDWYRLYQLVSNLCRCFGYYCRGVLQLNVDTNHRNFTDVVETDVWKIPALFTKLFGMNYTLRHYVTMTTRSLYYSAIFKNRSVAEDGIVKGFGYLARHANLSLIMTMYGVTNETIISGTLAAIGRNISEITLAQLKQALGVTSDAYVNETTVGSMLAAIGRDFSNATHLTLHGILQLFLRKLAPDIARFKQPVIYVSFIKGISMHQISSYSIYDLALATTGLSEVMMRRIYGISSSEMQSAKALNFSHLPTYIKQHFGVDYSQKQVHIMSFQFCLVDVLLNGNITVGANYLTEGVKFVIGEVTFKEIKGMYNRTQMSVSSMSVWSLVYDISNLDYASFRNITSFAPESYVNQTTIGEMFSLMSLNQSQSDLLTMKSLLMGFSRHVTFGRHGLTLPVAYNAFRKGISITNLLNFTMLETTLKMSALSEKYIPKLQNISNADLKLPFGHLRAYVNQTLGVNINSKHFRIMSLNSIFDAVFINKNASEVTQKRFLNDFRVILRNVTFGDLKKIFGLTNSSLFPMTVAELGFFISGIDLLSLKKLMGQSLLLNETKIGAIANTIRSHEKRFDHSTIHELLAISARVKGLRVLKMPVVYASHLKNISINQIAGYNIMSLAILTSGLPEMEIMEHNRMPSTPFQIAKTLSYGQLPAYVKFKMGIGLDIKHFYTLSYNSIAETIIMDSKSTEDQFSEDLGFIATNVTFGEIKQIFGMTNSSLLPMSFANLAFFISGVDAKSLQNIMGPRPWINQTKIGEAAKFVLPKDFDKLTIDSLIGKYEQSLKGFELSKLPVMHTSSLKNITMAQISGYQFLHLAGQATGLSEIAIKELYHMSAADFQNAKTLYFGQFPSFVKQNIGANLSIKHFTTMSFNTILETILIRKNVTEANERFMKDFGFIIKSVKLGQIQKFFGLNTSALFSMTIPELAFFISNIDPMALGKMMAPSLSLNATKIGEIAKLFDPTTLPSLSIFDLLSLYPKQLKGLALAKLPVIYAAHLKGITISQVSGCSIMGLSVKITGLSEIVIKELHRMSNADFQASKILLFGQLPAYVKLHMGTLFSINHFYTMSLNSIADALLIHKNLTEGTKQFLTDFRFVAQHVRFAEIKRIYAINESLLMSKSLWGLGYTISAIDFMQFKTVLNVKNNAFINQTTIKEIIDEYGLPPAALNSLTIVNLLGMFAAKVTPGIERSKLPIIYAAFLKGISIHQLSGYNIIRLAVDTSGLSETMIKRLHSIPPNDFIAAKNLAFGQLPLYVKQRIGADSILKHYYTMSFHSIAEAFLVHINVIEAAKDFVQDFHIIASNLSFPIIFKMYNLREDYAVHMRFPELLKYIADANVTHVFRFGPPDYRVLGGLTIRDCLVFLKSRNNSIDLKRGTITQLAMGIVANWRHVPGLFDTLGNLSKSSMMDMSMNDFIRLAHVTPQTVQHLLKAGFISSRHFQSINNLPLKTLAERRIVPLPVRGASSIMLIKLLLSARDIRGWSTIPFIAAGFYNGFTVSQIASSNVLQIAERVFGFDARSIISAVRLNSSAVMMIANITYRGLSHMVQRHIGKMVDYRQLYHMSFYDLLDAVLLRKDASATTKAIDSAIRFIALRMSLHETRVMYEMSHGELMNTTLIDLSRKHVNVSRKEISTALNLTLQQELLLERVRVIDAHILLGAGRSVMSLSMERVGHQIITLGPEAVLFFTPIDALLRMKSLQLSVLSNTKLPQLARLFSVPVLKIEDTLRSMNITKDTINFIFAHPLADFASVWSLSLSDFAKWDIFRLFWHLKTLVTRVPEPCAKFTQPCTSNANCLNPKGRIFCRCNEGYSGNGTYCYDGCTSVRCGTGAACVNVPGSGATCSCIKPGHVIRNGKCIKQDGRIIKVSGLKFKQVFKDAYKNSDSKEFKNKAAEIENILKVVVCQKIFGCIGIEVLLIRKGSIVMDFSVTIDSSFNNVTKEHVLNISREALKDEKMIDLGADLGSNLGASKGDVCQMGWHDCGANSKCVSGSDGSSYVCECSNGYDKDGNDCKKKSKTGLIVGVTVGVVLFLFLLVVLLLVKKKHKKARIISNDIPFSLFKGSRSGSVITNENAEERKDQYMTEKA
ncbi:uncharacterized protein LOC135695383 [Rhopilema esculentum]|uniref:uncharacterized protein LOC135695383 n=1 Tax=Rhopilema esculentum TaxID=499914 RepID=UPI0031E3C276